MLFLRRVKGRVEGKSVSSLAIVARCPLVRYLAWGGFIACVWRGRGIRSSPLMSRRFDSRLEMCGGGIKERHWAFNTIMVELEIRVMAERLVRGMERSTALARVPHLNQGTQRVKQKCDP
jgi:hypothetical protein